MTATATEPPDHDDLDEIQGNLVGFNKDHERLLFITFPDPGSGRAFMTAMAGEVNTAVQVKAFNHDYKTLIKAHGDPLTLQASWVNLHVSFTGLQQLGADGIDAFPDEFKQGMKARAAIIGDVNASDPANWTGPFVPNSGFVVHAMIIVAADSQSLLDDRTANVRAIIQAAGVAEFSTAQDGQTRPEPFTGHEHFGFKDGISQPSIGGVTRSSKGGEEIAAGEFLVGYEDQDGNVSGQPGVAPTPPPAPPSGYSPVQPSPAPQPLPSWCKNASFAVYRRLRQDVAAFRAFLAADAAEASLTSDQLGAKLVGRWPSGAPLENVLGGHGDDPTVADPSIAHPSVLADAHINKFGYQDHDTDGHLTPLAAHIRKAYPRDQANPGREEANRHRIARRGIIYGPEFVETEQPYGGTAVPDNQDRGLLFICYQSSIARGFEFIQSQWANQPDFPATGAGEDPIISQNNPNPPFTVGNVHLVTQPWVTTTGGEYFLLPSKAGISHLGGGDA